MSTEGRRDRTGEPVPHDFHDPDTCSGWLGEDSTGAVIPCLFCKPHLAPDVRYRGVRRALGRRPTRGPTP